MTTANGAPRLCPGCLLPEHGTNSCEYEKARTKQRAAFAAANKDDLPPDLVERATLTHQERERLEALLRRCLPALEGPGVTQRQARALAADIQRALES